MPHTRQIARHIGVCKIWLHIPESRSLKTKRRVIKGLIARLKNRFNIAVAEVDALDVHQSAGLAVVSVSNDTAYLNSLMSRVITFIETNAGAELVDYETEFFF